MYDVITVSLEWKGSEVLVNKILGVAGGVVGGLAGAAVISAAVYMPFVISDARKKYRDKYEYLLILGGNVVGADTPSAQLFERMKSAAVYLKENPETVAVPCGGCFRDGQKKSEAERIILEDKSTTTYENFEFGTKIIENHAGKTLDDISIAFLSSDYHLHRAAIIAKRCGVKNCGRVSSPTPGKALPRYARECIVAVELLYRSLLKK